MSWMQYEVWAKSEDGPDEVIHTTASLKEAREVKAKNYPAYILCEDEHGDISEVD